MTTKLSIEELIARMDEFDPSDRYHDRSLDAVGYYAAIDRCISLLKGEINSWTDH
jgi:hypothetical protein